MNLENIQQHFLVQLLLRQPLAEGMVDQPERFRIYQHNVFSTTHKALTLVYPTLVALVGGQFFWQLAEDYTRAHPPVTGNLDDFGGEMAAFLAHYPAVEALAYLPDVARLEWLMQESSLAAHAQVLDASSLAGLPPERYSALRLQLHPSARLFSSCWAVDKIQQFCAEEGKGESLNLEQEEGCRLLIVRPFRAVKVIRVITEEYHFLEAIQQQSTMEQAYHAACPTEDQELDLAALMQRHLGLGTFRGFTVGV